MATKILLADDSMTAQKMGKDILTAAGYEVTAVSNGAAASKKLVDKFDVIILDVYMPGYNGLEVCEKVRANMEIAKTPVLLTVGKMEHYEPADTARVKADGVIIKPFEATDLLAIVKKLVDKGAAAAAPKQEKPEYEKTMVFTAAQVQEFKDQSYAEWKTDAPAEAEVAEAPAAPAFEMTQAEASAPAFAMDMAPSVSSFDETVNIPPAPKAPASSFDETVGFSPAAAMNFGMGMGAAAAPAFESSAMAAAPGFEMADSSPASGFDMAPASSIPSFEAAVSLPTLEPTVMASVSVAASVDPDLEVPHVEAPVAYSIPSQDPALASRVEMASEEFITRIGASEPEPEAVPDAATDEAAELAAAAAEIAGTPAPVAVEDDFEARVAAAMSGFESGEPVEAVEAEPEQIASAEPTIMVAAMNAEANIQAETPIYEKTQKLAAMPDPEPVEVAPEIAVASESVIAEPIAEPVIEAEPVAEAIAESQAPPEGMHDAALVEQMQAAFADLPVETAPHIVEEPIAVPEAAPEPAPSMPAPEAPAPGGHDMELASALAAAIGGEPAPEAIAAVASTSAGSGMDHHTIAQVVSRVMERMLPAVMHEIAKELESAKK